MATNVDNYTDVEWEWIFRTDSPSPRQVLSALADLNNRFAGAFENSLTQFHVDIDKLQNNLDEH